MNKALNEAAAQKREDLMTFLRQFTADNGYAPSLREIGQAVGISSTSNVAHHLHVLSAQKRIRFVPGLARTIQVIEGDLTHNQVAAIEMGKRTSAEMARAAKAGVR